MTHYEERLEQDINHLGHEVSKISGQVLLALQNAIEALLTGNRKLANETILHDGPINRAVRATDRLCHSFIARHLPSGAHLRLVSSIIRTNIELERLGDYAVNISREATMLDTPPEGDIEDAIKGMSKQVTHMLNLAIASFEERDAEKARTTMAMAEETKRAQSDALKLLEVNEPGLSNKALFALMVVFNMLERVSDQAKNLCEEVVFSVTGETKKAKRYNILFVDQHGAGLAQLAATTAQKKFPEFGHYRVASDQPADTIHPAITRFAQEYGFELNNPCVKSDQIAPQELRNFHVIISLEGSVLEHFKDQPFHPVKLDWNLGDLPVNKGETGLRAVENIYRNLVPEVENLMHLLRGEESA